MSTFRPSLHSLYHVLNQQRNISVLTAALLNELYSIQTIPSDGWWLLLGIAESIPPFTLLPRFILNLRELYVCDARGRLGYRGNIDSAFGFTSVSGDGAAASAIVFVDGQNEGLEQGEEVELEERKFHDHSAGSDVS